MSPARKAVQLVSHLGPRWVMFRLWYALQKKTGVFVRRSPVGTWEDAGAVIFGRREPASFPSSLAVGEGCVVEAEAILKGNFRLFSRHQVEAGFPPAWHRNPLSGQVASAELHWSRIGDFGSGDIKGVWELSRFPWAWPLARAFVRTGDERYVEGFWVLFENWLDCNPPNRGANWMCGQEATFRLMAVVWAIDAIAKARASTPDRHARASSFVLATGRRVAANLDYALSQSNNHGVSECVGLVTAALYLPAAIDSAAWRTVGLRSLERQIAELVYPDGGFAQHSAVYHRVLLHDLLWLVSTLRCMGETEPTWLLAGARRALDFIDTLLTTETGRVPLYGANDGANILPLADADYLDFRPVVQAGYAVLFGTRRFAPGPWDEAADWLAPRGWGKSPVESVRTGQRHFPMAGVLVWSKGATKIFFRCPTRFSHRPSQADLLHVDLEWRGQSIAHDAGTFSYNAAGPFAGGLKEARYHNTLMFDGAEPLEKVGRFLYLPWPRGEARWNEATGEFISSHDGWRRAGLVHERRVSLSDLETVIVTDRVTGAGRHRGRLHWLLADLPHSFEPHTGRLDLRTPAGDFAITWNSSGELREATLVRADRTTARGWRSPYYSYAAPALSLAIEFEFSESMELTTTLGPRTAA